MSKFRNEDLLNIFNNLGENKLKKHLKYDLNRKEVLENQLNSKKDENKAVYLLEEIIRDLKNYELELRIEELESKFAKDLSENTFNEIRELKKKQNIN